MRRAVMFAVFAGGLWLISQGLAADAVSAQTPSEATHEIQRAPDGSLRRGLLDVPAWVVFGTAALVTAGAATALGWRLRRKE
ncbi:MAG: hypothetical protein AB8I08_21780 [Sandaracinaceae bacterium]